MTEGGSRFNIGAANARFWDKVRPIFHEYFQFWPDHEDLIWAKSVWPILEDAGFFADCDEEAHARTRRNILALAVLYAESAQRFGTPDYQPLEKFEQGWLTVFFGSRENLDETLWEIGSTLSRHYGIDYWSEGNADLFLPLIRSLATGSGCFTGGPELDAYLKRAWQRHPNMCEFREDRLHRMWVGGHFSSAQMACFL